MTFCTRLRLFPRDSCMHSHMIKFFLCLTPRDNIPAYLFSHIPKHASPIRDTTLLPSSTELAMAANSGRGRSRSSSLLDYIFHSIDSSTIQSVMSVESSSRVLPALRMDQVTFSSPPLPRLDDSDPYSDYFFDNHWQSDTQQLFEGYNNSQLFDQPLPDLNHLHTAPSNRQQTTTALSAHDPTWSNSPHFSIPLLPSLPHSPAARSREVSLSPLGESATPSSPPTMPQNARKRRRDASPAPGPSQRVTKRTKATTKDPKSRATTEDEPTDEVEVLGEKDNTLSSMVQQQQDEQHKKENQPTRLSSLQCVICLEPPTDMTVTFCGMFIYPSPSSRYQRILSLSDF